MKLVCANCVPFIVPLYNANRSCEGKGFLLPTFSCYTLNACMASTSGATALSCSYSCYEPTSCIGPSSLPTTIIPQTLLHSAHSELIEAKSESGRLVRELRGRTLQVRSLEVQQGKCHTDQDDTARELGILRAQLVHTILDSLPIHYKFAATIFLCFSCSNASVI